MRVTLRIMPPLTQYTGGKSQVQLSLPEGTSALQAALAAGLPAQEAGIITVRGRMVREDSPLADGDEIEIFPPIIGG